MRARRRRCAGVHRRHRRARGGDPRPHLCGGGLARCGVRSGGQRRRPRTDRRARQPRRVVGDTDRRRMDDCLSYPGSDHGGSDDGITTPRRTDMHHTNDDAAATGLLSDAVLQAIHAYWRAANYLSVGQIYLMDNPLLREPLTRAHVKTRPLGHWGTTPGLNFVYAHLNRVIKAHDLNVIYVCGPGHGGPGMVANTYLEGTYSEIYPHISQNEAGMQRLFRQFSFPGGIPSHAAPETPGSINEGGELGYALVHAYGAAFDNPDLIVACVVGDAEVL